MAKDIIDEEEGEHKSKKVSTEKRNKVNTKQKTQHKANKWKIDVSKLGMHE